MRGALCSLQRPPRTATASALWCSLPADARACWHAPGQACAALAGLYTALPSPGRPPRRYGCKNMVFSSSCTVYGNPQVEHAPCWQARPHRSAAGHFLP